MLGIVLVSYKTEDKTIAYVQQELSKIQCNYILVIVNNSCTKESNIKLAEGCRAELVIDTDKVDSGADIFIIGASENLGYAKGNNLGAAFLRQHFNIDYYLFTNNDVRIVDGDVVEKMIEVAESRPSIGVIGPRVTGLDGKEQNPRQYITVWRRTIIPWLFLPILFPLIKRRCFRDVQKNAGEGEYYGVSGSFMLVRKEAFEMAGMFDPNTFLYAEELILSERMLPLGFKTYFCPHVKVIHEHGQVTGRFLAVRDTLRMSFESDMYYYRQYKKVGNMTIFFAKLSVSICLNVYLPIIKQIRRFLKCYKNSEV